MTDLQIRQGYANGTLTDCDVCGATMKTGGECEICTDVHGSDSSPCDIADCPHCSTLNALILHRTI